MAQRRKRLTDDDAVRPRKRRARKPSLDYTSKQDEKDYRPSHKLMGFFYQTKKQRGNVNEPDKNTVHRPDKKSLRDPFRALAADIVFLIIHHLPARDTEILRRVSKLWKESSEAHCGRNALQKHFPLFSARADSRGSWEEENLRFRRCLYHRESLSLGYATRAIQCTGAVDWHLDHDTLVWSNTRGHISARRLRNASDQLPNKSHSTAINFPDFHQPFKSIQYVQLTDGGDMMVKLRLSNPRPTGVLNSVLLRITTGGILLWRKELEPSIGRPALGKQAVYILCYRDPNPSSIQGEIALVKMSLEDGSVLYRTQLDVSQVTSIEAVKDKHLQLTRDENFLVWRAFPHIYVWSTETGKVVFTQDMFGTPPTSPLRTLSSEGEDIWDMGNTLYDAPNPGRSSTGRVKFKKSPLTIKIEDIHFPPGFRSPSLLSPVEWRFDGNHSTFFSLSHGLLPSRELEWRFLGQNETTDVSTSISVAPMNIVLVEGLHDSFDVVQKGKQTQISLPSRTGKLGRSRILEADLPWKMAQDDFLGMENDYLVYHCPSNETLLLVDFWPDW